MAAGPKGVAGRYDSLPAQRAAADPLQNYRPDLDQWPGSWAYEARDIPYALRIMECFKPLLRELLALSLSRPTLRRSQPPSALLRPRARGAVMKGFTLLHTRTRPLEINCTDDMSSEECSVSGRLWTDRHLPEQAAAALNRLTYLEDGPVYVHEVELPEPYARARRHPFHPLRSRLRSLRM